MISKLLRPATGFLLAMTLLFTGFSTSFAQVYTSTTEWQRSVAAENLPDWFGANTERGLAYVEQDGTKYLLIASAPAFSENVAVYIVNAETGEDVDTLDLTGYPEVGTFQLSDVMTSEDGKIFLSNYGENEWNGFQLHMYDDINDTPTLVLSDFTTVDDEGWGLSRAVSVVGNFADGTATVYAVSDNGSNAIARYTQTGPGENFDETPEILVLDEGVGSSPMAAAAEPGSADFYQTGAGEPIRKYAADGTLIGAIPTSIIGTGTTRVYFLGTSDEGHDYLSVLDYVERTGLLVRVPEGNPDNAVVLESTETLGDAENLNGTGDIHFEATESGFDAYVMVTNNGIGSYSIASEPIEIGDFALLTPADGAELLVEGEADTEVVITWERPTSNVDEDLFFTWHLDARGGNFSEPIVSIPADNEGNANQVTLTLGAVDDLLEANGLNVGDILEGDWTVTAEAGDVVQFATTPFEISLERGVVTIPPAEYESISELLQNAEIGEEAILTNEVIVTFVSPSFRNQHYLSDTTGAVLVDDDSGVLTGLARGDGITGFYFEFSEFSGTTQLIPLEDIDASTTGNDLPFWETTLADFEYMGEPRLMRVENVLFQQEGNFEGSTNYGIIDPTVSSPGTYRTHLGDSDVIGQPIPQALVNVFGIAAEFSGNPQLYATHYDLFEEVAVDIGPFALESPADGTELLVEGAPFDEVVITWERPTSDVDELLQFTWHLDARGGDFADPIVSLPADNNGNANQITLSIGTIDDVLEANGLNVGDILEADWTVTAEIGTEVVFADAPFAIDLERGELDAIEFDNIEDFANFDHTAGSYQNGTFEGQDGSIWEYVNVRGDGEINPPTPGLQNNTDAKIESGTISGGITVVQFDYKQMFSTNVNLSLYVNDEVVATVTSDGQADEVLSSGPIPVSDVTGDFVLRFQNNSGGGQVAVDNVEWASFELPDRIAIVEPPDGDVSLLQLLPNVFNMDTEEIDWTGFTLFPFSGAELARIPNPDASGLNATDFVLEYVKPEESDPWAGFFYQLEEPVFITDESTFRLKVWSPRADIEAIMKLENSEGASTGDLFANVTAAGEWVELEWDLSGQDIATAWDRVTVIMDLDADNPPAGGEPHTWYLDDFALEGVDGVPQPPFTTLFQLSAIDDTRPDWFGADTHTERGMAAWGDNVYVASRNEGTFVYVLDAQTGEITDTLNTEGVSGGTFPLNDVEVSGDGRVYAGNLAIGDAATFKLYELHSSNAPRLVLEFDHPADNRLGDKLTIVGNWNDGGLTLYAPDGVSAQVFKFEMNGSENGMFSAPEIIELGVVDAGSSPVVAPLADGRFFWTASGRNVHFFEADGTHVGEISSDLLATSSTALRYLGTEGDDQLLAAYQHGHVSPEGENENARVVRIPGGNLEEAALEFMTPSMRGTDNPNGTGEVAMVPLDNGNFNLFVLGTNNGIGGYNVDALNVTFPDYSQELVTMSLAEARALPDGRLAMVKGIVNSTDFGFGVADYFIQDETAGLNVTDFVEGGAQKGTVVEPGDSILIMGEIATFNNQRNIEVGSFEITSRGNPLPEPIVIEGADMTADSEFQGMRVQLRDMYIIEEDIDAWPEDGAADGSGVNIRITSEAEADTFIVRLARNNTAFGEGAGQPLPPAVFHITGSMGQFREATQLFPFFADDIVPAAEINWANLQWPPQGDITEGEEFIVFAQVYVEGITDESDDASDDIQAWIGVNTENVAPTEEGWTWIQAEFNAEHSSNNHEYMADIGSDLDPGTYYYVSRFQLQEFDYVYGGFQGGFWDGEDNVSGQLNVAEDTHADMADVPREFGIDQNYPNPFNPATNIRYAVPETAHVTIRVYNVTGQLVATLVNETRDAGYHNVSFDGTQLASGVYIYRMQAGDFTKTRKLMLIK
ncbi:MAG: DUF4623 domain-containing protein [Cyclonatronaceae bacterium]